MSGRINVVYQFNEKYAPYAAVSMVSVLENNKDAERICIYVLGEGLLEESVDKLKKMVASFGRELIFPDASELFEKFKEWNVPKYRGSYAANLRLFLPAFIGSDVDRILYIDADTIVAGSLMPLMEADLDGKAVGMVLDSLCGKHKDEIGIPEDEDYYNSGMMIFDLKTWMETRCSERIIDHIINVRAQYPSPDQDLVNVVCHNQIKRLGAQYNFQPVHYVFAYKNYIKDFPNKAYYTEEEIKSAKANVTIYHFLRFVGEFPWHKNSIHPYTPMFDEYLALTPWADYNKALADNGLVLKIEKVMYKIFPKSLFLWIFSIAHRAFYKKANKLSLQNQTSSKM